MTILWLVLQVVGALSVATTLTIVAAVTAAEFRHRRRPRAEGIVIDLTRQARRAGTRSRQRNRGLAS